MAELKTGYDQCFAEFQTKQLHDSYWECSMKAYIRYITITVLRQRLLKSVRNSSLGSGGPFPKFKGTLKPDERNDSGSGSLR